MEVVLGVDGGNSKTELLAVSLEGDLVARARGPGNNAHAVGPEATVAFLGGLVERLLSGTPASHGVFYLCGVDIPSDRATLAAALEREPWVERATVDNDVFPSLGWWPSASMRPVARSRPGIRSTSLR